MRHSNLSKRAFNRGEAGMGRRILLFTAAVAASCATADVTTWIGGSSGAVLDAANWDNGKPNSNALVARITNSVTFTETGSAYYWYHAAVQVAPGVTVTFKAR